MKKIELAFNHGRRFAIFELKDENMYHTKIKNLRGIQEISIYYIDSEKQQDEKVGNIIFPSEMNQGDLDIVFDFQKQTGEIKILGTNDIWSYDIKDVTGCTEKKTAIIDRQEVLKKLDKKEEKKSLYAEQLIEALTKDIFGQEEGITVISEIIASNWNRKNQGVTVILIMGPTGVGKSQIARNMASVLSEKTGREWGLQIVAMNEFVGDHYTSRFFGSPPGYVGFGQPSVFEPVRKNPYQVFVFDEIEKASDNVWTALMEAFSAGVVHMADNSEDIDLSHCIIVMTSNLQVDMDAYNQASPFMKKEICRDVIAKRCGHPEIAGKITNCLAFQKLSDEARLQIIQKAVEEELMNYDMQVGHIESKLVAEFLHVMKSTSYGARAIIDAVRMALMHYTAYQNNLERFAGKTVELTGSMEQIEFKICA